MSLDSLRRHIAGLDRAAGMGRQAGTLSFGVAAIDRHLGGGLRKGALHELAGGGCDLAHGAAAALFAATLLGRAPESGPVLWVLPARDLFAPGLAAAGLEPDRLIVAETGGEAEVLAVAEEALRHRGLAGVVAETAHLPLIASRRLQLAAESSGVAALVIRRWQGRQAPDLAGTVAMTRWRFTALASVRPPGGVGFGAARWRMELLRCRGGEPGEWVVEAGRGDTGHGGADATGGLRLVADLADRPAAPGWRPVRAAAP